MLEAVVPPALQEAAVLADRGVGGGIDGDGSQDVEGRADGRERVAGLACMREPGFRLVGDGESPFPRRAGRELRELDRLVVLVRGECRVDRGDGGIGDDPEPGRVRCSGKNAFERDERLHGAIDLVNPRQFVDGSHGEIGIEDLHRKIARVAQHDEARRGVVVRFLGQSDQLFGERPFFGGGPSGVFRLENVPDHQLGLGDGGVAGDEFAVLRAWTSLERPRRQCRRTARQVMNPEFFQVAVVQGDHSSIPRHGDGHESLRQPDLAQQRSGPVENLHGVGRTEAARAEKRDRVSIRREEPRLIGICLRRERMEHLTGLPIEQIEARVFLARRTRVEKHRTVVRHPQDPRVQSARLPVVLPLSLEFARWQPEPLEAIRCIHDERARGVDVKERVPGLPVE